MGLGASLARPGGNATGANILFGEVVAKRLGLLHDLVPKAVRVAVLVNPANTANTEATLREIPEAARGLGAGSGHQRQYQAELDGLTNGCSRGPMSAASGRRHGAAG
jgi:hypothetical protein